MVNKINYKKYVISLIIIAVFALIAIKFYSSLFSIAIQADDTAKITENTLKLPIILPKRPAPLSSNPVRSALSSEVHSSIEYRKKLYHKFYSGTPAVEILSELARAPFLGASALAGHLIGECAGNANLSYMPTDIAILKKEKLITDHQSKFIEQAYKRCVGADSRAVGLVYVALQEFEKSKPGAIQELGLYKGLVPEQTPKNRVAIEFSNRLSRVIDTKDPINLIEFGSNIVLLASITSVDQGRYFILDGMNIAGANAIILGDAWYLAICEFGVPCDFAHFAVRMNCHITSKVPCANTITEMISETTAARDKPLLEHYRASIVSIIANRQPQRLQLMYN